MQSTAILTTPGPDGQRKERGELVKNIYTDLEARAFWKTGVENVSHLAPHGIYKKRWDIDGKSRIATAGSCFAQHISRHLRTNGYQLMDVEPAPALLNSLHYSDLGYNLYSGRYGNIYTNRQLLQLVSEVFSNKKVQPIVWEKDGRFYDAKRPTVEAGGFSSIDELTDSRIYHLQQLKVLFRNMDLLIFTMGLTETWAHKTSGEVVPVAPGVIAGQDEIENYKFLNFSFPDLVSDFEKTMKLLNRNRTKPAQYILTVSPVPLTATASGNHVLQATTYSKSALRAAAGYLFDKYENIDYFPSYEIIMNPGARGTFFKSNLRSVAPEGVEVVMDEFFRNHPPKGAQKQRKHRKKSGRKSRKRHLMQVKGSKDVQCEEALSEAFVR